MWCWRIGCSDSKPDMRLSKLLPRLRLALASARALLSYDEVVTSARRRRLEQLEADVVGIQLKIGDFFWVFFHAEVNQVFALVDVRGVIFGCPVRPAKGAEEVRVGSAAQLDSVHGMIS